MTEQPDLQPLAVETTVAPDTAAAVEAPGTPPPVAPATPAGVETPPTCPRCEKNDRVRMPSAGRVSAPFCDRCMGFLSSLGTREEWAAVLAAWETMHRNSCQVA
jgi:hypothetical protein